MRNKPDQSVTMTRKNAKIFDMMGLTVNISWEDVSYDPQETSVISKDEKKKTNNEREEQLEKGIREKYTPYDFVKRFMGKYLKYVRYYPKTNSLYIYSLKTGVYKEYSGGEFRSMIGELITKSPLEYKVNMLTYRDQVMEYLKSSECTYYDTPKYDWDCIVFTNGVMDMKDKKFRPWTPDIFLTSCVDYKYDPTCTCPHFLQFLNEFCGGYQDRVDLIRSWMHTLLTVDKNAQVFLYVFGPPKSGKSMFTNYVQALLGKDKVVNTTLKSLNTDRFELHNVRGKALILISDADRFEADLPILKQITGSDTISSTCKYVQGSFPIEQLGNVMIISNHPFRSKDNTDAMTRRLIPLLSTKSDKPLSALPLISPKENSFKSLHDEMSGIFNWVVEWDSHKSLQILSDVLSHVPSIKTYYATAIANINPLCSWVQDCLIPGLESDYVYIGLVGSDETTLYGNYKRWAEKEGTRPLAPRRWAEDLLNHLHTLKQFKKVTEKRMNKGKVFTHVKLLPDNFILGEISQEDNRENTISSDKPLNLIAPSTECTSVFPNTNLVTPLDEDNLTNSSECTSVFPNTNLVTPPNDTKLFPVTECTSVFPNKNLITPPLLSTVQTQQEPTTRVKDITFSAIVKPYFSDMSYKDNPLYDLSKVKMTHKDLDFVFHLATKDRTHMNDLYVDLIKKRLSSDTDKIAKYGLLVKEWAPMGTSPRWQPLDPSPGNSVTGRKNHVKYHGYSLMKNLLDEHLRITSSLLLDIDIVSCYFNILIGTFKHETEPLGILFNSGIWKEMEKHFINNGYSEIYNKKWAKIALYSSFFGGGDRAMTHGILESERTNMGLTPVDFKNWEGYRPLMVKIDQLVKVVKVSDIILTLKNSINLIKKNNTKYDKEKGGYISYLKTHANRDIITVGDDFSKNLSNMLMETEILVLSQSMIEFKKQNPNILLLGHFHDGVSVYIPNPIKTKQGYIDELNKIMSSVSSTYNIYPPLKTETKDLSIYGL